MTTNNLTVVRQLRCDHCGEPIERIADRDSYGLKLPTFRHVGEPCRRYYGKDPETNPGFPVERPDPVRRCAACWPHADCTEVGDKPEDGTPGVVRTYLEAWGDATRCSGCTRSNWYSIGD